MRSNGSDEDLTRGSAPSAPEARPAAEALIARAFRVLLMLMVALGAPFVFGYRSEGAVYGNYSPRYLFGVLIPFATLALLVLFGSLAHTTFSRILSKVADRLPRLVGLVIAWAAAIVSAVYALRIADEYVSLFMLFFLPGVIVFIHGSVYGGVEGSLAMTPLIAGALLLFAIELTDASGPLVVWGDDSTFAMMFPREPPYTGPGGRLRPGLDTRMRAPEYRTGARLVTNSQGFRNEEEFEGRPLAGELRVLSLGDSFSTGFCADQSAFFGADLQVELQERLGDRRVQVMNAEVSDPAYGLRYLQRHGVTYGPSLVIYGLSGNDIMQSEQFNGPDRLFHLVEGRLEPNPDFDPALESAWSRYRDFVYPLPGTARDGGNRLVTRILSKALRFRLFSSLAVTANRSWQQRVPIRGYAGEYEKRDGRKRLVDGAANLAFFYRRGGAPVESMYAAFFELLVAMERTTRDTGARLLLVVHPFRYQIQPRDWEAMAERWNLAAEDFDLRLMNRRLAAFASEHDIALCDLIEPMGLVAIETNLYLPGGDTHYNRAGHAAAARATAVCIDAMGDGLSVDVLVGDEGEELAELLRQHDPLE